jgi:hypothetical protein
MVRESPQYSKVLDEDQTIEFLTLGEPYLCFSGCSPGFHPVFFRHWISRKRTSSKLRIDSSAAVEKDVFIGIS